MTLMLEHMIEIFRTAILPYYKIFLPVGGSIFILLIIIEILKEAIDITTGKGINLGAKLITILFIGTILLKYDGISTGIYSAAMDTGREIIPRFEEVNNWIDDGYRKGVEDQRTSMQLDKSSGGLLTNLFLTLVMGILSGLGLLFIYIAMMLIIIFIAGAYASLALSLALGPVFIAMLVSGEFRQTGAKWILILLSYFLTIPIYIIIIKISASLYSGNVNINDPGNEKSLTLSMSSTIEKIGILMINPLITVSLIFSVSKIVGSITGGAGNIAEKVGKIAMSTAAVAMMAAKKGVSMAGKGGKKSSGKGGEADPQGRKSPPGHQGVQNSKSTGKAESRHEAGNITLNSNPPQISNSAKPLSANRTNTLPDHNPKERSSGNRRE